MNDNSVAKRNPEDMRGRGRFWLRWKVSALEDYQNLGVYLVSDISFHDLLSLFGQCKGLCCIISFKIKKRSWI